MTVRLEVITGPMCSGKSEEFIRRIRRATIGRVPTVVFKSATDTRNGPTQVCSRAGGCVDAIEVREAREILDRVADAKVVGIDEAQFFDPALGDVVRTLLADKRRVIVAGLDLTWEAKPFPVMADLLALATEVVKNPAVCQRCGEDAWRSQRLVASTDTILVGSDAYEPRCLNCFEQPS